MLQLNKGNNLNLTKDGDLRKAAFALGWSPAKTGPSFDLDAFAIGMRGENAVDDDDVLYYNSNKYQDDHGKMQWADSTFKKPYIWDKAMWHSGDELTGGRDGDDETITIDLDNVPAGVTGIAFCVNIFKGKVKRQNFGMVSNSFIRVDNAETKESIVQYDLQTQNNNNTGVVIGYLEKSGRDWEFYAIGSDKGGFDGDMNEFAQNIVRIIRDFKKTRN